MNMSSWNPVRMCVLSLTYYFLGLSSIFGQCQINCISSLEISLDQTGSTLVLPYMFLIDSDNCTGQKEALITNEDGQLVPDNTLNCTHIGQTLVVEITDIDAQSSCWSTLTVIDNSPPKILNCIDHNVYCNINIPIEEIGNPTFEDNCGFEISNYFIDEIIDQPCNPSIVKIIKRTWYAANVHGTQAVPCTQHIYFEPISIGEIILPEDILITDCESPNTLPSVTGFPNFESRPIENLTCQFEIDYSDQLAPLCGNTYKIFRTWSIYDWCMTTETIHNQTIEIIDTIPPLILCNGDTLKYFVNSQHECFADVSLIELEVTDNCSDFDILYDWEYLNNTTQVPLGIFPITANAIDDCNNQSTCDFYIQVLDQQTPTAICESNLIVSLNANGSYLLEATFLNTSSTDNCEIADYLVSNGAEFSEAIELNCEQLDTTVTVSLMVVDESGNASTCSAEIMVIDTVVPEITCPADVTIKCYEDPLDLFLTGNATATDNCQDYEPSFSDNPDLNICNSGIITRTFSVFENGFEISCQQIINLEIDSPFVVFPIDITVDCGQSNNLALVGQPIVTAMCPGFLIDKNDSVETDTSCNVITTRIWKVIDNCLDTIYKSKQIITEIDTLPPTLINEAFDVILDCTNGDLDSLQIWLESNGGAIAMDNCTDVIWTNNFDEFNFACGNTGNTSVIFTATDQCGNYISTSAEFNIIDTLGPVFTVLPMNLTLPCELNIQQEIDHYLLTNGGAIVTDLCSEVQITTELVNEIDSQCATFEVLTTATDACGLLITATSTITIFDKTPPLIEIEPQDIEISCESGDIESQVNAWISTNGGAIATDLCGGVTWTNNFDFTLPQCGTPVAVLFTAIDECDNNVSATATYTVVDNISPTLDTPAIDVTFECDGFGNTIDIDNFLDNNGFAIVTDNCSDVTWVNDYVKIDSICAGTGTSLVTFTATDICGNTTVTDGLITIEDTTSPEVLIPIEEFVVECDGFGNIFEFNTWVQANGNIAVSDICGDVEFTFDFNSLVRTCANAGSVFTVFVAADECDNKTNIITNFVIEDTTPPIVNCPDDLVVTDEDLDCTEFIILPPTTAIDACNGTFLFSYEIDFNSDGIIDITDNGPNASGDYPIGIHTVNYFVEDECGNIGDCQQVIEVIDGSGEEFSCVETYLLGIDESGTATLSPEDIGMISTCMGGSTALSQSIFTCDDCGINEVIFTFTDENGISETCTTNVFVCNLTDTCADCIPCGGLAIGGTVSTENNLPVEDVIINVSGTTAEIMTDDVGAFYFEGIANNSYSIAPYKDDDPTNGVTTLDLIAIQRHILGISILSSPYQKIAADANNSGSITTLDIVDIQRVILEIDESFNNNTSWRFLERAYNFPDPNNPFTSNYPETISINGLVSQQVNNDFVGVKIGDVNNSFVANFEHTNIRNKNSIPIYIDDQDVDENEIFEIPIVLNESLPIEGYQFTIGFDSALFEFVSINQFGLEGMTTNNFGVKQINKGILLCNWINPNIESNLIEAQTLFSIKLKAKRNTSLHSNIWIENGTLNNEVYLAKADKTIDLYQFEWIFNQHSREFETDKTRLFQNAPNPFTETTQIKFFLPEQADVDLSIYDATGRIIWSLQRNFPQGENVINIQGTDLGNEGIYMCSLNTTFGNGTIKLVHISNF